MMILVFLTALVAATAITIAGIRLDDPPMTFFGGLNVMLSLVLVVGAVGVIP